MSDRDTERRRESIRRLARDMRTGDVAKIADKAGRLGILRGLAFGTNELRQLEVAKALSEMKSAELFEQRDGLQGPQRIKLRRR